MTKQRQVIYDILKLKRWHLTAEQIYFKAKEYIPSISIGTVYRNLGLMVKDKEIKQIYVSGRGDLYDGFIEEHDHAFCVECGEVSDIETLELKEKISNNISGKYIGYSMNIYHICPNCLNKNKGKKEN